MKRYYRKEVIMIVNDESRINKISAKILDVDKEIIKIYIQGAVNAVCNYDNNSELSVRILFGGNYKNWSETPLQKIYDYHKYISGKTHEKAAQISSVDVGYLLKEVLSNDVKHNYRFVRFDTGKVYKLE